MSRGWSGKSTWELARVYLARTQELANPGYKKTRWRFVQWWRHRRYRRLLQRQVSVTRELATRYEGVLREICSRIAAQTGGTIPNDAWRDVVERTWESLQHGVLHLKDARGFSTALWHAATAQIQRVLRPRDTHIMELMKPKFMLRQFVDEMSDVAERTALRLLAYRGSQTDRPDDREGLRMLEAADPVLHTQLDKYRDQLHLLTDGAIAPAVIAGIVAPFAEYGDWLFPE